MMDELEQRLRSARPLGDLQSLPGLTRAVGIDVALAFPRTLREPVRRRAARWLLSSRRRLALTMATAVLLPAAATAGILHFSAETGMFANWDGTGRSQAINMCAADVHQYIATLLPSGQPLPPDTSWDALITDIVSGAAVNCHGGRGELMDTKGLTVSLIRAPACSWERWVVNAPAAQQSADLAVADRALAQIPVAAQQAGPGMDSAWREEQRLYTHAPLAFVTNAYRAYCTKNPIGTEAFMPTSQVQQAAGQ